MKRDKKYIFDICFGLSSVSGDMMAKVTKNTDGECADTNLFDQIAQQFSDCEYRQKYHLISGAQVRHEGKKRPLWWLTKKGITPRRRPAKNVKIYSLKKRGQTTIKLMDLAWCAVNRIRKVNGDFCQDQCIRSWIDLTEPDSEIIIMRYEAHVSAGTYVRQLTADIIERYNEISGNEITAIVGNITRTSKY